MSVLHVSGSINYPLRMRTSAIFIILLIKAVYGVTTDQTTLTIFMIENAFPVLSA